MAERNAVSKLINGDGPSQPSGPFSSPSGSSSASPSSGGPSSGGSSPGGPAGGGGGQAVFTASAIRALGGKIAALEPMLERASSSLKNAEIGSSSFSSSGIILANIYPEALAFGTNDIKSKITQLDRMAEKLRSTAMTWERAEQASTVHPQK